MTNQPSTPDRTGPEPPPPLLTRRDLVARTGAVLAAGALGGGCARSAMGAGADGQLRLAKAQAPGQGVAAPDALDTWEAVRDQFLTNRESIHLASFLISSHPRPVRAAIEHHRQGLDRDPYHYIHEHYTPLEQNVLRAAARYMAVNPEEIALTDSTTMSLGLLYQGLELKPGQEILTTVHDHYSTHESLRLRSERHGVTVRKIPLFDRPQAVSADEVAGRLTRGITRTTRAVATTWVHSNTGVKLPIRAMSEALARVNASRDEADRVLLCVDGVHGFAAEDATVRDLGCDFFMAGCHKWLYGPRGTGLIWSRPGADRYLAPLIPSMSSKSTWGGQRTPGGFHSFEHRWALDTAFEFHLRIGKSRIASRIHALNRQLKEGLAEMGHVTLYTPMDDAFSAGMVCFDVRGHKPNQVVDRLWERGIIASQTPYDVSYARLAAGICNTPDEMERTLAAVRSLG
jgi:isopenicillin-N epimerase